MNVSGDDRLSGDHPSSFAVEDIFVPSLRAETAFSILQLTGGELLSGLFLKPGPVEQVFVRRVEVKATLYAVAM
jgi:hypothetical protein